MTTEHCIAIVTDTVGIVTLIDLCIFGAFMALSWLFGRWSAR
jgi:hypothetical protein